MNISEFHRIINVKPLEGNIVRIKFDDNSYFDFDLNSYIYSGSVFESLRSDDIFNKVSIAQDGRALEFPGGLDFCADSLWLKAHSLEYVSES